MWHWHRVGIGVCDHAGHRVGVDQCDLAGVALALFVPSEQPAVTVAPAGCGAHVILAAGWALDVLGHGCRGGHLVLVSDPATPAWTECLATALAVDDAAAAGHRPAGAPGPLDRVLRDPRGVAALVAAVRL